MRNRQQHPHTYTHVRTHAHTHKYTNKNTHVQAHTRTHAHTHTHRHTLVPQSLHTHPPRLQQLPPAVAERLQVYQSGVVPQGDEETSSSGVPVDETSAAGAGKGVKKGVNKVSRQVKRNISC